MLTLASVALRNVNDIQALISLSGLGNAAGTTIVQQDQEEIEDGLGI